MFLYDHLCIHMLTTEVSSRTLAFVAPFRGRTAVDWQRGWLNVFLCFIKADILRIFLGMHRNAPLVRFPHHVPTQHLSHLCRHQIFFSQASSQPWNLACTMKRRRGVRTRIAQASWQRTDNSGYQCTLAFGNAIHSTSCHKNAPMHILCCNSRYSGVKARVRDAGLVPRPPRTRSRSGGTQYAEAQSNTTRRRGCAIAAFLVQN